MQSYFVAKTQTVKLASGKAYKLIRGVHPVPDEVANSPQANDFGIKPIEEMTDADYRAVGMKKP